MEKYIIILVILATIYYIQNCLKTTEGFETTSEQSTYGVDDLNSINTLAQISKNLMRGGLTVPGNMDLTGKLGCGNNLFVRYLPHPQWLTLYPQSSGNWINILGPMRDSNNNIITDYSKADAGKTNMTSVILGNDGSGNLMIINGDGGTSVNGGIRAYDLELQNKLKVNNKDILTELTSLTTELNTLKTELNSLKIDISSNYLKVNRAFRIKQDSTDETDSNPYIKAGGGSTWDFNEIDAGWVARYK